MGPRSLFPSTLRIHLSVLQIIVLVLAALLILFFVGGVLAARRRAREEAPAYARHLSEADQALEQARAADRGWDRAVMEEVARAALNKEYPAAAFGQLDLVLVDDRPGVNQDTAHFEALDGDRRVTVVLCRGEAGWSIERIG